MKINLTDFSLTQNCPLVLEKDYYRLAVLGSSSTVTVYRAEEFIINLPNMEAAINYVRSAVTVVIDQEGNSKPLHQVSVSFLAEQYEVSPDFKYQVFDQYDLIGDFTVSVDEDSLNITSSFGCRTNPIVQAWLKSKKVID